MKLSVKQLKTIRDLVNAEMEVEIEKIMSALNLNEGDVVRSGKDRREPCYQPGRRITD